MSSAPRRTPLTVKLAYGQLALAVAAFTSVPLFALKSADAWPFGGGSAIAAKTADDDQAAASPTTLASADPIARGEAIFGQSCVACHQATGQGIPGVFPPLAGSDYLLADADRAVRVVLNGLAGPVTVNGVDYNSAMPPMPLADDEVAAVLTYVMQAWGNTGPAIDADAVARVRAATGS